MIWKLCHKLFGWDYIHWENSADYGVARVHKSPEGTVWFWRYKNVKCCDVITSAKGGSSFKVVWLTCKASDYLEEMK